MSKKIIVICREYKAYRGIDVDSRMYDENMIPIMAKYGNGIDGEYHLGQVSSNFAWAKQDCAYERYGKELNIIFPFANSKFSFEYIEIPLCNK